MINRGCRPGSGCVAWILFNAVNPRLVKRVRDSGSTEWKVGGRSVPPSCLTGEEKEGEGEEAERDAVLGITSDGGL